MADEGSIAPAPTAAPDVSAAPDTSSAPTTAAPESQTAPQTQAERYKIKANGQEREFSREEIEKYASMGLSANEKWEEAAKLKKSQEAWLKQLKTAPGEFLSNPELGIDMDSIAMDFLSKKVDAQLAKEAEARMTPEERQAKADADDLKRFREQHKQTSESEAKAAQEAADTAFRESTTKSMVEGLKAANIPYTNFTHNSILQYMSTAMDAGKHDVTVEDVMPFVQRDYHASFDGLFEGEDEELLSRFSPEKIQKIQDAVIKRAKGGNHTPKAEAAPEEPAMSYQDQIEEVKRKIRLGEI